MDTELIQVLAKSFGAEVYGINVIHMHQRLLKH